VRKVLQLSYQPLFADSFPGSNPTLLIDGAATAANIRKALQDTLGAAAPDDVVIFSFSGHGSHDHRLAAFDTTLSALTASSISVEELAELFKSTKAKAVFCILDCCFSGAAPAKVLEDSPIPRDAGTALEPRLWTAQLYCSRSASVGSNRAARQAGAALASSDTRRSTTLAAATVNGSSTRTP